MRLGKAQSAHDPARRAGSQPSSFMGKVWKQQMYPQYATYYYPQYLQAKVKIKNPGGRAGAFGVGAPRGELMEGLLTIELAWQRGAAAARGKSGVAGIGLQKAYGARGRGPSD